jgi:hypothetical protein
MSHRREQKEALRRERERREAEARAAQQRKRMVGVVGAVVIAVAAVAILVVVLSGSDGGGAEGDRSSGNNFPEGGSVAEQKEFDLAKAASAADCELTSSKGVGAGVHTTEPNEKVNYEDNPPTNGRHYEIPADDGLYNGAAPPDTALVHSLEHGRVIIWANPSLPADARAQLRALFDEDDFQLILVRRADMPYAVAATAWNRDPVPDGTGRTLGCAEWSEGVIDALRDFRDEHRSNGPEDIP